MGINIYFSYIIITICTMFFIACDQGNIGKMQADAELKKQKQELQELKTGFMEKGQIISARTFEALRSELMKAMSEGGVENAVKLCKIEALPITDSLSKVFNAGIKRTALLWRNPANAPDETEKKILNHFTFLHKSGIAVNDSIVQLSESEFLYVKPIILQGLCTVCHGSPGKSIKDSDYALIKSLYPEDKAVWFNVGDLRGMWSIRFKKE